VLKEKELEKCSCDEMVGLEIAVVRSGGRKETERAVFLY
jgi:hypothetical protein